VNEGARLIALQRRVQSDPAPFVFAQLAEEYRRAGRLSDAVECCRTGLQRHPGYLSARLILARSLSGLARWEEAAEEYEQVVAAAPDNLAATRELADVYEKRARPEEALTYYRRALALARNDRSLEAAIGRLSSGGVGQPALTPVPPPPPARAVIPNARQVDFDAVLSLLGRPHQQPPPLTERLLSDPTSLIPVESATATATAAPLSVADPRPGDDVLATLERDLRGRFDHDFAAFPTEEQLAAISTAVADPARVEGAVMTALQAWLDAIARDRDRMAQP